MKRLLLIFPFLCIHSLTAQVEDISFTLTPMAEYVWWDDQAGLSDDFLYGGKVGFGFGEYLELSGVFQAANNLQTNFSSFGFANFSNETFEVQNVNLRRYGGELKVNFSDGVFSPYMTLGTGIQRLELNDTNFEQIYAGLGLGLRLALTDRINLLFEGRAIGFNIDAASNLLTPANQTDYGINPNDSQREETVNLSASAALQIYLGGRKPGELSALDKAYLKKYRGGFQGWSWVIEPSLTYVDFDADSFYRNTWMAGGYFGVDFTDFVGVRAYYFQALEDEKITTDLDRLSTYGLEFRAKLNDGRGVNPYLILGGGYLNVQSNYVGNVGGIGAQSTGFANAGLGLDIPLGRNVLITGGARAMATSSREVSNSSGPDVLQTHVMYNAGIKIQIGKKPEEPEDVLSEDISQLDMLERGMTAEDEKAYKRIRTLIKEYNKELNDLDEEIEKAYQQKNTQKAIDLLEDKKRVSKELRDVEKLERMYKRKGFQDEGEYLKMTPEEFENLIDRILKGIDEKYKENTSQQKQSNANDIENEALVRQILEMRKDISDQNKLIAQQKEEVNQKTETKVKSDSLTANAKAEKELELIMKKNDEKQKQMDERMKALDQRIEDFNKQVEQQQKELAKAKKESESANENQAEKPAQKAETEEDKKKIEKTNVETQADEDEEFDRSETETEEVKIDEEGTATRKVLIQSTGGSNNVGYNFILQEKTSWIWDKLTYKGASVFTGFNFGEDTSLNVGVRGNYGIGDSIFELMPDAYYGFGDFSTYGANLNAILPFNIDQSKGLKAYVGTGAGVLMVDGSISGTYNVLIGSYVNLLNGRLFVDYTNRNIFGNNMLSVGYRLPF